MKNNIQLIYASRTLKSDDDVREDLMSILSQALDFNTRNQIYGVLYYGHGFFFQCLEGEQHIIEHLYHEKIAKDPRHCEVTLLKMHTIKEPHFKGWHMKYAPYSKTIMKFFITSNHNGTFNPYLIEQHNLSDFLEVLQAS